MYHSLNTINGKNNIHVVFFYSWIAVDDGDDDDDDLTSISNTTLSKNNDHIVLSQLECRFFNR